MDLGIIGVADERGRQTRTKKEEGARPSHSLDGTFPGGERARIEYVKNSRIDRESKLRSVRCPDLGGE